MPKKHCARTSQAFPSMTISAPITQRLEQIYTPLVSPVREPVLQAAAQDLHTKNQACGLKPCVASMTVSLHLLYWKTLTDLLIEGFAQCLDRCEWLDIRSTIHKSYRLRSLARDIKGKEFLSFPTPNASDSKNSRCAGQTRLETAFKRFGLKPDGYCLSAQAMALIQGFPTDWTMCLSTYQKEPQEESDRDSCLVDASPRHKQLSLF